MRLPALRALSAKVPGASTTCPNKVFLVRRILEGQAEQRAIETDGPCRHPVATGVPVPPPLPVPPKRPFARHNLRTVVDFEFTRTMKKRAFWIATLSIPVVMAIVFALVYLSNSSTAASEDALKTAAVTFTYTDDSGLITPDIATAMGGTKSTDSGQALQDVKAGVTDAFFAYPADPATQPVKVYGTDMGIFENGKYDAVAKEYFEADRFEEFCGTHLKHLDEVAWDFFGTERAKDIFREKVAALYPKHEIEPFTEHFYGLVQFWRKTESERVSAGRSA